PTSVDPVNPIFATRGSAISAEAVVAPGPGSTLKVPSGRPASIRMSAIARAVSGLCEDLVRAAAPVLVGVRHDVDLGASASDRLPTVPRLECRELLLPLADQERGLGQDVTSLPSAHAAPRACLERVDRDVDRSTSVLCRRFRDLPGTGPGRGLHDLVRRAV